MMAGVDGPTVTALCFVLVQPATPTPAAKGGRAAGRPVEEGQQRTGPVRTAQYRRKYRKSKR